MFLEKGLYKDKYDSKYFEMNVSILQMLYFDRSDVSKGTAVDKKSALKECDVFHFWYFLNYNFNEISTIYVMIYQ